jgi:hypothetical protein
MQCWPLARGSFISERPQKQLSDYSVHKWWSSVITTLSALASLLAFLVFTVTLPLCGGNVNYLKLRCDEVALLPRTCVIAYDKWHSFARKCRGGCGAPFIVREVCCHECQHVCMFSQSLPVLYRCRCQHGHFQSIMPVLCSVIYSSFCLLVSSCSESVPVNCTSVSWFKFRLQLCPNKYVSPNSFL